MTGLFSTVDFASYSLRKNLAGFAVLNIYYMLYALLFAFAIFGVWLLLSLVVLVSLPFYAQVSGVLLLAALYMGFVAKGGLYCELINACTALSGGSSTGPQEFFECALGYMGKSFKLAALQLVLLTAPVAAGYLLSIAAARQPALAGSLSILAYALPALGLALGLLLASVAHYMYYPKAIGGSAKKGAKELLIHLVVTAVASLVLLIPVIGWIMGALYLLPFFVLGNVKAIRG